MYKDTESIEPYSPEHIGYFLGWLYRSKIESKKLFWDTIVVDKLEEIETNLYLLYVDYSSERIRIHDLYDSGTHHNFFSREEWYLEVTFDQFKQYICLNEIDYNKYYEVQEECNTALEILELDDLISGIDKDKIEEIKSQIKKMSWHMDLNKFIPDYHKDITFLDKRTDLLDYLHDLALSYIEFAKPYDVIAHSKLYQASAIPRL